MPLGDQIQRGAHESRFAISRPARKGEFLSRRQGGISDQRSSFERCIASPVLANRLLRDRSEYRAVFRFLFAGRPWKRSTGPEVFNPDFVLHAEVVEALEGGPLILKATLVYQGKAEIKIKRSLWWETAYIETLRGGRSTSEGPTSGDEGGAELMAPRETRTKLLLLHHAYSSISSGKVPIEVKWPIRAPGNKDDLLACPSTTIEVDILPASEENLTRLRKRLEAKMEEARKLAEKEQEFSHHPTGPATPIFHRS